MRIIMPTKITEIEINSILEEFSNSSPSTQFDFSSTEFISPYASVLLIIMFEEAIKKFKKKINLKLSQTSQMKSCMYILARLGFFENLPREITYYPFKPKFNRKFKGKNEAILEVTGIKEQEAGTIINKVEKAITKNTDYPEKQKLDICVMVSEMIQNIFYHSGAAKSGIIAVQNFDKFNYMQMVIADSGKGIPQTIRGSEDYKHTKLSDYDTILESVKKGVSCKGKGEDRGEGLSRCVDLAKRHKARLYIRSNSGFAYITFKRNTGILGDCKYLAGTQIFVNFPCS